MTTAVIEHLPASPRLPRGAPGRFRPLRAGIRNVWEYDDQEFWFSDGRLILRGHNTAGKSKALELLFPFVLDGDTRPQRLDPFGSVSKTMQWNLVGFDQRESAIGYCWAEFGRVDEEGVERYVTCIVGMRAVRSAGTRVDTWFAVTPDRIGGTLELAPGDVPLTAERFREALGDQAVFSTSAREHRAAVDHALFGLGPERYDALIHLLLQLRRPKLSEKLDMSRLGEYLSDALPPLEHRRMETLGAAFARLDEETAALERLEASARELRSFLDHYRMHARIQTRLRADEVRSANTQFDRVTERARAERDRHGRATSLLADVERRLAELGEQLVLVEGQLAGLDLSKVHALQEVERRAREAAEVAGAAEQRATEDRAVAERDRARADATGSAWREAVTRRDDLLAGAAIAAGDAGLGREHELHAAQLAEEPERARLALRAAADRRQELVRSLRRAADAAAAARQRVLADQASYEEAEGRADEARAAAAAAEAERAAAVDALVQDVAAWSAAWRIGVPEELVDDLVGGERPSPRPLLAEARHELAAARGSLEGERGVVAERRRSALAERKRVAAERELPPPAGPGRPAARPAGFVPLWACVDFAPTLSEAERAGLEAGLEASGVLDALVGPDGTLLDAETLDTMIVPGRSDGAGEGGDSDGVTGPGGVAVSGPSAAGPAGGVGGLVPSGADPASAARALAALGAVGSWSLDGRWTFGALAGRWTKDAPAYIGAAARAEARRRRVEELTAAVEAADAELASIVARLARVEAEVTRLDEAEAAWPSTERVLLARQEVQRCTAVAADASAHAARALAGLERSRAEGRVALDALAAAEAAADCPATDAEGMLAALATYREALGEAAAAALAAAAGGQVANDAATRASESGARAADSEQAAMVARGTALSASAEAEELRRTSGADADAVLARQRALTDGRRQALAEQEALRAKRDGARDEVAAATALLEAAERDRADREQARAAALARLAALASTELAQLAVGPVAGDRDLTQVTAGLTFARAAYERLRELEVDQRAVDASATRFHNAYTRLQSQLGVDFNPFLDRSDGLEVCFGTLNGKTVTLSELSSSIDQQLHRRRETLTAEERELIHRHLLTEVGSHLGDRVHAAWALTRKMNDQLAAHPTRGGVRLELSWEVAPNEGSAAEQATRLLRQDVHLLDESQRASLANFLHERVRSAREDAEGADMAERLAGALDYRRWHRFSVYRVSDGRRERLTSRTQGAGSGGEQAKLAHLPLFAATAAYYESARSTAPRLLMLDEAFAGIDDSQRGDCMGMLVDLDLDMVLTNYAEWGCYREIPSVATYHLERRPGQLGVTALRFVWDGNTRREDDPWLEDREVAASRSGDGGLFA